MLAGILGDLPFFLGSSYTELSVNQLIKPDWFISIKKKNEITAEIISNAIKFYLNANLETSVMYDLF